MTKLAPVHPGEVLADYMEPFGLTAHALALKIQVPANRLSDIIRGRRSMTADTALRLGAFFKTSPEFWMNLQTFYEIEAARDADGPAYQRIAEYAPPTPVSAR